MNYPYKCEKCGDFVVERSMKDEPLKECPTCSGPVQRIYTAVMSIPNAAASTERESNMETRYTLAILALKDQDGNLYAYSDTSASKRAMLKIGEEVEVPTVDAFPYSTFSSSRTSLIGYAYTAVEVSLEMSVEEYDALCGNGLVYYRFKNRKVLLLREIEDTWHYAKRIIELEDISKRSNLLYGMRVWHSKLGFKNQEEFDIYADFIKASKGNYNTFKHSVTKFNLEWTEKAIDLGLPIEVYDLEEEAERSRHIPLAKRNTMATLQGFLIEKIAAYLYLNSIHEIEKLPGTVKTKELFDSYLKLTRNESIADILDVVPGCILQEYGPDEIFSEMYTDLQALVTSNNYKPYEDEDYTHDDRDSEVEKIARILPLVTERSLPLLRTLETERIAEDLSVDVLGKLITREEFIPYNQLVLIAEGDIKIEISIVDGEVSLIRSNKYVGHSVVERRRSEIAVYNARAEDGKGASNLFTVYDAKREVDNDED